MKQKSILSSIELSGPALHSGKDSSLSFRPAPANSGIVFRFKGQKIRALVENVTETDRGTSLGDLSLVEHVLAAVSGLGIDNLLIELSSNEPPNIDGSALPFVRALKKAQIVEQDPPKDFYVIQEKLEIKEGESSLAALPFNGFKVDFMIDFPAIGRQEYIYTGGFEGEIAPARTFGFIEEIPELLMRGLAQGATLKHALGLSREGYVNEPRFKDEPVRHKILDLIGDLALVGKPLKGHFIAKKSGHKMNVQLAKKLFSLCSVK